MKQSSTAAAAIPFPAANLHKHAHAVIDIGSNSVRMVVYHAPVRVPMPLFNEKYYCGLGRGMAQSGVLHPQGKVEATAAIGRFIVMARRLEVADITVLATAAVRDASDGTAFIQSLKDQFRIHPLVISGEMEAELSAKGILASVYDPIGISADMGGGSIELAFIHRDHIERMCSFELGGLRLADESGGDPKKMRELISRELDTVKWLNQTPSERIYAIGGSFRAIAKMQMKRNNYPLSIVHEYYLSSRTINQIVELLSGLPVDEIENIAGVPKNRAPTILPAALMLQQLMQASATNQVVFSVTGLREGLLYDRLDTTMQMIDPLVASAQDLAALAGRRGRYAQELFDWMQPLFEQERSERTRLRFALCTLSELAWTIDPNFRAEWAYLRVIQSAIKGISHRERVMLAMALFHRYQNKWKQERPEVALLDEQDRLWARCVGIAANLAFNLSGGKQGNLHHARLRVEGSRVLLELDDEASPLRTDTVENRLDGLGSTFKALSNFII
jgi:exopolyphosphatase/guanosine-5'-triphosphate,3'-diphosphate pyrophosphatase